MVLGDLGVGQPQEACGIVVKDVAALLGAQGDRTVEATVPAGIAAQVCGTSSIRMEVPSHAYGGQMPDRTAHRGHLPRREHDVHDDGGFCADAGA